MDNKRASEYHIRHVGWLLAALSPINRVIGQRHLAGMEPADRALALARARELEILYKSNTG